MLESTNKQGNVVIKISGMSCNHCVQHIEKALQQAAGVIKAKVDLAAEEAYVEYDPSIINEETLLQVISEAGYEVIISG